MADTGESSSSQAVNLKPMIVRVKRKAFHSPLEAFCEENVFYNMIISSVSEKLKTKKVFLQHVETVSSSKATIDVLQSFVARAVRDEKTDKIKKFSIIPFPWHCDPYVLAKHARFEQIWKRRKGKKETMHDDSIHELCHLYDVVRVDVEEEKPKKVEQPEDTSLEDSEILCNYLPLIREFLPDVTAEIQSDIQSYLSNQASTDDYVYDLYTVQDDLQVGDDDDFYDGPIESEWESDSNAEDNPMNEYPSNDESEELESRSSSSHLDGEHESRVSDIHSEDEYSFDEEEEMLDDDEDEDGEDNWRWEHR
ncbi:hypothetical protein BVC80_1837g36 [Macleaya cordata]|uniref:RNA-directed DNA methylation 4 n=1 Tax=Macleaya cordata TaxID=56857 RepID=A0A200R3H8_MACCD|nr:hypothetical protein BVC80_1837g36 [Macleaya cordata]